MIEATVQNFEAEVIQASMTVPVLVDFWAPWCAPCKSLGPILEKLELAYAGRFKLVKIDSDQEQQISQAFGIRSIPTCVLLINGQPADGFTGALPESKVREFLDKHVPPALEEPELIEEEPLVPGSPDAQPAASGPGRRCQGSPGPSDAQDQHKPQVRCRTTHFERYGFRSGSR
jgi:putative thioredoxin